MSYQRIVDQQKSEAEFGRPKSFQKRPIPTFSEFPERLKLPKIQKRDDSITPPKITSEKKSEKPKFKLHLPNFLTPFEQGPDTVVVVTRRLTLDEDEDEHKETKLDTETKPKIEPKPTFRSPELMLSRMNRIPGYQERPRSETLSLLSLASSRKKQVNIDLDLEADDDGPRTIPVNQTVIFNSSSDSIALTPEDLSRLSPDRCLNDTLIDFYLKYIFSRKLNSDNQKRFHFFNTFFFSKLKSLTRKDRNSLPKVLKWTKGIDIRSKDFLVVPIHEGFHWTVIIVCHPWSVAKRKTKDKNQKWNIKDIGSEPCILYLDSLGGSGMSAVSLVRKYLNLEWEQDPLPGEPVYTEATIPDFSPKVPHQLNSSDCGVYVLHYVERFCLRPSPSSLNEHWFTSEEISRKREEIKRILKTLAQEQNIDGF
eukprot:TRINITY_DN2492_c0_g1_i4.p1 TRINITY_DN2492_c0_g1~~TRINITY_DN2492_c0_g1_i4.p1  ORF type:complete len:438 (-),score=72.57 TRINITY_DN2492_c0_g1_i4:36-1304(-)